MKPLTGTPPKTMMEVFKTLPEGTMAELIENALYMSPSPVFNHVVLSKILLRRLLELIEDKALGQVFCAPFDVYLDDIENAVQPDLFVVLKENYRIIDEKGHIHGIPDFIIEILSKGNKQHDLIRKKELYEKFAVKEYWVIDPDTRLAIGYRLVEGSYQLAAEDIGILKSSLLNVSINF